LTFYKFLIINQFSIKLHTMNKSKLFLGGILMLAMSMVIWSCKDDFTEEDQLKLQADLDQKSLNANQDSVALSIQVYNASTSAGTSGGRTTGLTGIAVKLAANGKVLSGTTDADGLVNFYVRPGSVSGSLTATGYTTVNFTLSVDRPSVSTSNHLTNASVTIPTFATTGATVSTVSGTATFEGDLTNNTRENMTGVTVSFVPSQTSLETYYSSVTSSGADIDKFSIESNFITTITNGAYTINLPVGINGLDYTYTVSDFTANQTIAINNYENDVAGTVRDVVTVPAVFSMSSAITSLAASNFTTIPTVASVQVDIDLPPAAFTTAATATAAILSASNVDAGNGFTILSGGSGYTASSSSIAVTVTPIAGNTPTTTAILYANSNASGQITSINAAGFDPDAAGPLVASDYGAGYRGVSTLTIGTGGAIVVPKFANTVSSITMTGGAGYVLAPTFSVRGLDVNGVSIESTGSTNISGGAVVSFTSPGTAFSKITSMTFIPVTRVRAVANQGNFSANSIGQISNAGTGITTAGSGYDPATPPAVTVRSLRARSAGATNATVISEMSGNTVNQLTVLVQGTEYSTVGANFPAAGTFQNFSIVAGVATAGSAGTPGVTNGLRPGVTRSIHFHAGTGTRLKGVL
jgi:hypothetical protein